MKKNVLILLCLFSAIQTMAQFQNHTWVIGAKDVVTFDTTSNQPVTRARPANPDYTLEGTAIANNPKTGEIYFYHDGHQIFGKNYLPIAGGTDIGSKVQGSTGQGAAIFTIPDCTNKKFIAFSNDADHSVFPFKKGKLYYTKVDMSSGAGVVSNAKTLIRSDLDEGMIVVNDYTSGKSWLVAKIMDENKFVSIPLTANPSDMLNTSNHVISTFATAPGEEIKSVYTIRYSAVNGKIALASFLPAATVATLNFNTQNGQLTGFSTVDKLALNNQGNTQQSAIGDVCWSPDGTKLYALTQKNLSLYQYDFSNNRNRTLIIQDTKSVDNGGMKVDPSGKIWVINNTLPVDPLNPVGSFNLSRIHNPNAAGGTCNFILDDFTLLSNGYFYFPVHAEFNPTDALAKLSKMGSLTLCEGGNVQIKCEGGAAWTWNNGATTQSISVSQSGSYFATASFGGCTILSDTFNVVVNSLPTVDAGNNQTVSCGSKVTLNATGSQNLNYQWIGNQYAGPTYSNVGQGNYTVIGTSMQTGCIAKDSVSVFEANNNVSVILKSDTLICKGNQVTLTPMVSGVSGTPSYSWSNGSTAAYITISPNITSSYSVTVTDPSTECSDSKASNIEVDSLVVNLVAIGSTDFCEGDSVELRVTASSDYTYTWSNSNVNQFSQFVSLSGIYSVQVQNAVCTTQSNAITVSVKAVPFVDFTMDKNEVKVGEFVNFTNTSDSPSGTFYTWTFGNSKNSNNQNASTYYENPGSYFVNLTASSPNECVATYGQTVDVVQDESEFTIFIPTAFTPNGDGLNDFLKVQGINIKSVEIFIHNRWGELLFYSPNQLVGWDGKDFTGKPMDDGQYVVSIIAEGNTGEVRKFGHVVFMYR
jgi:gliding motility-associated-like protein